MMLKLPKKPTPAQPAPAPRGAATRPATRPAARTPTRSRPARVLPLLALLFFTGAGLRFAIGLGEALAQHPATPPATLAAATADTAPQPASSRSGEPLPLRTSPVSDAQLTLEIRNRERAVATREAELEERAALLAAAQDRLQAQIDALRAAEADLAATMALADRAAEDDIARLVTVFEAMKPEDAAAVFTEMDPAFAAGFLGRLAPAAAAAILAGLEPRAAYGLSAILAGRNALVPRN